MMTVVRAVLPPLNQEDRLAAASPKSDQVF
jgi:hypothetical protein